MSQTKALPLPGNARVNDLIYSLTSNTATILNSITGPSSRTVVIEQGTGVDALYVKGNIRQVKGTSGVTSSISSMSWIVSSTYSTLMFDGNGNFNGVSLSDSDVYPAFVKNPESFASGYKFSLNANISIRSLKVLTQDQNNNWTSAFVGIYDSNFSKILGETFSSSDELANGYRYKLIRPYTLNSGTTYYIMSFFTFDQSYYSQFTLNNGQTETITGSTPVLVSPINLINNFFIIRNSDNSIILDQNKLISVNSNYRESVFKRGEFDFVYADDSYYTTVLNSDANGNIVATSIQAILNNVYSGVLDNMKLSISSIYLDFKRISISSDAKFMVASIVDHGAIITVLEKIGKKYVIVKKLQKLNNPTSYVGIITGSVGNRIIVTDGSVISIYENYRGPFLLTTIDVSTQIFNIVANENSYSIAALTSTNILIYDYSDTNSSYTNTQTLVTSTEFSTSNQINGVSMSSDGRVLIAFLTGTSSVSAQIRIYTRTDIGNTFTFSTSVTNSQNGYATSVKISADGSSFLTTDSIGVTSRMFLNSSMNGISTTIDSTITNANIVLSTKSLDTILYLYNNVNTGILQGYILTYNSSNSSYQQYGTFNYTLNINYNTNKVVDPQYNGSNYLSNSWYDYTYSIGTATIDEFFNIYMGNIYTGKIDVIYKNTT